ncbi:MAG: tetratricopeptide repeat protein [Novosphingobium sp.]|nr:tetratricopeptide repeat protein [Novosphingobium sp.]
MQIHSVRLQSGIAALTMLGLCCVEPAWAQESEVVAPEEGSIEALEALSEQSMSADTAIDLARRQAEAGKLLEAAATLERALILDEDADDVRLAYVAILCRLDDRQSARLELNILSGRNASGSAWDQVEAACGSGMARKRSSRRVWGQVSVGLSYEGDALGSFRISPDQFLPENREDGLSFVGSARLSGRMGADSHHAYIDARFQTRNSLSGPQSDFQFGELAAGFGSFRGNTRLSLGGVMRRGWLNDVHFVKEYGGEAEVGIRAGRNGRAAIRGEVVRQEFADNDSTGYHYDLALTYEGRSASRLAWFAGAGIESKDARLTTAKYFAWRLSGAVEMPLDDKGSYSRISSTLRMVDFKDDPLMPPRQDVRLYNRLALGTPLGLAGLYVEGAATYSYRNYNIASGLRDYRSFGGDLRLIWRFGSGS